MSNTPQWAPKEVSGNIIDPSLYCHLARDDGSKKTRSNEPLDVWILDHEIDAKTPTVSYHIEAEPATTKTFIYFGMYDPKNEELYTTNLVHIPYNPDETRFYTARLECDFNTRSFIYSGAELCKFESTTFHLFCILTRNFDVGRLIKATLI